MRSLELHNSDYKKKQLVRLKWTLNAISTAYVII